jgi:hypothetical protein
MSSLVLNQQIHVALRLVNMITLFICIIISQSPASPFVADEPGFRERENF